MAKILPSQIKINDIKLAREVLTEQSTALADLATSLGEEFSQAVALLMQAKGRVIVSGMGKSGHIARKIAATMASTGTPAQFVHPGEASHGDLGMVTEEDVVLALSNSGETAELADVINYTRRFHIPLISITSKRNSALSNAADVALVFPKFKEACPLGLAPTTSTTLTLALGDALAVVLMDLKGFTSTQFKDYHPGGKLGANLLKVSDLMLGEDMLPLVELGTKMDQALIVMSGKNIGGLGVTDNSGDLIGVITDGDLKRHMSKDLLQQAVDKIMTALPKTIEAGKLASEALGIMNEKRITWLFVVEDKKPIGLIHMHDCLRAGLA